MNSIFINKYIIDFNRYLTLFLIIIFIRQTSSGVLPTSDSPSLYTSNDKVVILVKQNFTSTVYQSKTAWLIEFYASWCGHCQSYANTYREVAIDTWGWKTVVRVGAINCYADENSAVCDQHAVVGYPTLQLIPAEASLNTSKGILLKATDAQSVERELIKELSGLQRTDKTWPNFTPINQIGFDDIYSRSPTNVKLILFIVERSDDYTGRQIMLDFSKYSEQLAIFRTTTDGKLWHRFQLNSTDLPALFIIHTNQATERINTQQNTNGNIGSRNVFNYAIRTYIHQKNNIDNFDDRDLEEIIQSKNALRNMDKLKQPNSDNEKTNDAEKTATVYEKLNMVDLETALSYMLRREIPRMKDIQGEAYDALIHWLTVLTKYFPGRQPIMTYLKDLLSKINQQPTGLTGKQFRELADRNTSISYLPNNQVRYQHCKGSSSQYRGYPCALWLLFHTLTVSQAQSESQQMHITEIPAAIKNFIRHFFGCRHCSENFITETRDLHQINAKDKNAAVLYLWKIHNHVNRRLQGDVTEDPKYPKIQFPSENHCSKCYWNKKHFDLIATTDFLLKYYSKDNFDLSSVENLIISIDNKQKFIADNEPKEAIMIEISNGSTVPKFGLFGFMTSILRRFPFHIFITTIMDILLKLNRRVTRILKRAIMGSTYFLTDEQEINRRSSIAGASYNLINSIVGSGVIGMSYAFRQSGYLTGIVLLGIVAILTDYSTTILLRSGQIAKVTTYQELVHNVLGKFGFLWLSLVQFLYPFICLISYNIIIGDTVTKVLHRLWPTIPYLFQNRYVIIFLCSCFVTLPLSLYRNIAKLSQISLAGLILVAITVLILIKRGSDTIPFISQETRDLRMVNTNIAESIGVMAFAFMCQHNSFLIFHSMNEKTLPRWRIVTLITTTIAFIFAVTYALTGYFVFGQQTEGDLLENYCHWDTLINIARLIYAINIMLTFPLECLVCRQVIEIMCSKWINFSSDRSHYIITILIVTASVILSLSTDCLGIVLELNGLLVASSLAYILPALCYLKLKPKSSQSSIDNIAPYIILIIGILLTLCGFILPLRHVLQQGYYCQHGIEPRYCLRMFPRLINRTNIKLGQKLFKFVPPIHK